MRLFKLKMPDDASRFKDNPQEFRPPALEIRTPRRQRIEQFQHQCTVAGHPDMRFDIELA